MIHKDELLRRASARLEQAGIDQPRREARLLLAWAAGCGAAGLLTLDAIGEPIARRFDEALQRRERREPMGFITGRTGFWTLDLDVSPDSLIPRADSETLIEALLSVRPEREAVRSILDLGTGSGCLLLAALVEYPAAFGVGVDLSPQAAALARRNALRHQLQSRSAFLASHWAEGLQGEFDVVLSNPPYIETDIIGSLMPEVALYEPSRALDGGADGLDAYRSLCAVLPRLLAPGGYAILEVGIGQGDAVAALAQRQGLTEEGRRADLGGIARALILKRA